MESLCGMLNGEGGSVVFGVTDEGNVVGQGVGDSTKREIASCIREFEPFPLLNIEYVGLPNTDKQLMVITTPETLVKVAVRSGNGGQIQNSHCRTSTKRKSSVLSASVWRWAGCRRLPIGRTSLPC